MTNNNLIESKKVSLFKVYWDILNAAFDPSRPLLAQIVITKRCNLSCGYCFEFDNFSSPVPLADLKKRIDELKRLRVVFVTLNGGEPLLHPQVLELVAYISKLGMIPMMNSNARVLTEELIIGLNKAGLFGIQISCDSLEDNDITKKSMKRLLPKLDLLKKYAQIKVRINGVLGSGPPQDVIEIAKIVTSFKFDFQCSLMRDAKGSALPFNQAEQDAFMELRKMKGRLPAMLNDNFQLSLIKGENVDWKCRSGARYFHLDAEGLVHLCQPNTGTPAKRIEDYNETDILNFFYMEKTCSKLCAHAYAHNGSKIDSFRFQNKAN
ncbi:MAG: radical SAM protein [Bacteroidia bacterium]